LRNAFGGARPPVPKNQLRALYGSQDYTGMVKFVRDSMRLDLRIRVGLVNEGGPAGAPAWVSCPRPMPPYGSTEFKRTLVTVFLRKSFLQNNTFEKVVMAMAHELSHIVLNGIGHVLREREEAVDLTAMLLGYRNFYVSGSEYLEIRPTSYWQRLGLFFERRLTGVVRRTYQTLGYLTPEEVRYASALLGRPLSSASATEHDIGAALLIAMAAAPLVFVLYNAFFQH
jgi:hypothetical protein